jgi:hypothetical protein
MYDINFQCKPTLFVVQYSILKKYPNVFFKKPLSILRGTVFGFQPKNWGLGTKRKIGRKNPPSLRNKKKELNQTGCLYSLRLAVNFWTNEQPDLASHSGKNSKKLP